VAARDDFHAICVATGASQVQLAAGFATSASMLRAEAPVSVPAASQTPSSSALVHDSVLPVGNSVPGRQFCVGGQVVAQNLRTAAMNGRCGAIVEVLVDGVKYKLLAATY
jgi:hypothetical protein